MKKQVLIHSATVMISVFVLPQLGWAQKENANQKKGTQGIFESRRDYEEFFGELKSMRDPEVNAMLPLLNDLAQGRPVGRKALHYGVNGNPLVTLLADKKIRRELEVIDDQLEQIEALNRQFQDRLAMESREMDLSDPAQVVSKIKDITESAKNGMENVFLPHQLERLRQLGVRRQMDRGSVLTALLNDPLASELEITEEQKEELQKAAKKIEAELARELQALKAKARKQLFSNLTQEQQQKLDGLIGDEYEFKTAASGIAKQNKKEKGWGKTKFQKPKKSNSDKLPR